jgi:hypothetical protein
VHRPSLSSIVHSIRIRIRFRKKKKSAFPPGSRCVLSPLQSPPFSLLSCLRFSFFTRLSLSLLILLLLSVTYYHQQPPFFSDQPPVKRYYCLTLVIFFLDLSHRSYTFILISLYILYLSLYLSLSLSTKHCWILSIFKKKKFMSSFVVIVSTAPRTNAEALLDYLHTCTYIQYIYEVNVNHLLQSL